MSQKVQVCILNLLIGLSRYNFIYTCILGTVVLKLTKNNHTSHFKEINLLTDKSFSTPTVQSHNAIFLVTLNLWKRSTSQLKLICTCTR